MVCSAVDTLVANHGPLKLLFFGPPGVGKGTFASLLTKKWQLPHVSTGDMIRAEIKAKSDLGRQFQQYNDSGGLVPDELVCAIAQKRLQAPDTKRGYVLDGFPRTLAQATALESFAKSALCLNFAMPDKFLVEKLAGRRVCTGCGKNFNVASISEGEYVMKPLLPRPDGSCDACGGKVVQRDDDKVSVVENRLGVYQRETAPLIDFYIKQGNLRTFGVTKGVDDFAAVERMVAASLDEIEQLKRRR